MSKAPAADYALEIIEFFAVSNSEIGIADISNSLNINKNAVSRVLEALLEKNWIYISRESPKKYKLTLRPYSLFTKSVNQNSIVKIATPYVERLNKEFGDAVYLGVKNNKNVMYVIHCDSQKEVRIDGRVGGEYPLHCSAPGKILLGYSAFEEIKNYFSAQFDKKTENTIIDYDCFISEANVIRNNGYAIDNEEYAKGIICIAVPIFDFEGNVVATLGLSTLTFYESVDDLIKQKLNLLKDVACEISKNLGHNKKE